MSGIIAVKQLKSSLNELRATTVGNDLGNRPVTTGTPLDSEVARLVLAYVRRLSTRRRVDACQCVLGSSAQTSGIVESVQVISAVPSH